MALLIEFPGHRELSAAELAKPYDVAALERTIDSPEWQRLAPNPPWSADYDLSPGELRPEHVTAIVDVLLDPTLAARRATKENDRVAGLTRAIDGVGSLRRISAEESFYSKVCYKLTTPAGKQMAVSLVGYEEGLGIRIPEDPYLSLTAMERDRGQTTRYQWEFSDPRAYLYVPIGDNRAVKLQQFGGEPVAGGLASSIRIQRAKAHALELILGHPHRSSFISLGRGEETKRELGNRWHYLERPGVSELSVIDIPVVGRI